MIKAHFRLAYKYFTYRLFAKHRHGHGIHSPFVYKLLREVIEDTKPDTEYKLVDKARNILLKDNTTIQQTDYGAGSRKMRTKTIANIARHAGTTKKYGQLLFRLVKHFEPKTILELGTSLGLSASYLSLGCPKAQLITMEGCPQCTGIAMETFKQVGATNIQIKNGIFDTELPKTLDNCEQIDFVFFDGNHKLVPTLKYFELCLAKCGNDSIFVFDDIHWSEEMEEAWVQIKKHPKVKVTVDLFFMGLVFFRREMQKQDFVIKF